MKITKAMGRACLKQMEQCAPHSDWSNEVARQSWRGLDELAGGFGASNCDFSGHEHYLTALAMCAAIAGVKPDELEGD